MKCSHTYLFSVLLLVLSLSLMQCGTTKKNTTQTATQKSLDSSTSTRIDSSFEIKNINEWLASNEVVTGSDLVVEISKGDTTKPTVVTITGTDTNQTITSNKPITSVKKKGSKTATNKQQVKQENGSKGEVSKGAESKKTTTENTATKTVNKKSTSFGWLYGSVVLIVALYLVFCYFGKLNPFWFIARRKNKNNEA